MEYILAEKQPGCFLCDMLTADQDRENLILLRQELVFILLNRYPYINGHCMIAPYRHVSDLEELTEAESAAVMDATQLCVGVLKSALCPDGLNVGINLGKVAGAGLEEHLHVHVVPRWSGDTNFMSVTAHTKVMPQSLFDLYDQLHPHFRG